jgi:hypothetical protein
MDSSTSSAALLSTSSSIRAMQLHQPSASSVDKELPSLSKGCHIFARFRRACKHVVRSWWAWEILAGIVSLVAVGALMFVLVATDGQQQRLLQIGSLQVSLNTVVAAISTVLRTSLIVTVAGPLNQSAWNWFASPLSAHTTTHPRPLRDLDTFGNAAANSWSSMKLLWRTRCR